MPQVHEDVRNSRLPATPWLTSWAWLRKGLCSRAFVVCSHWAQELSLGQGQTVTSAGPKGPAIWGCPALGAVPLHLTLYLTMFLQRCMYKLALLEDVIGNWCLNEYYSESFYKVQHSP